MDEAAGRERAGAEQQLTSIHDTLPFVVSFGEAAYQPAMPGIAARIGGRDLQAARLMVQHGADATALEGEVRPGLGIVAKRIFSSSRVSAEMRPSSISRSGNISCGSKLLGKL